jgi:hypothetical protein
LLDYLLSNAAFAGAAYWFDIAAPGPADTQFKAMHGNEFWTYWFQVLGGLILSVLLRKLLRYPVVPRRLFGAYMEHRDQVLPYVQHRLFPWRYDDASKEFRNLVTAVVAFLAMFMYRVKLQDAANSLSEPFSNGILVSITALVVSLLLLEIIYFYLMIADQPVECTLLTSKHKVTAVVALLIVLLDLLAFEHGHWIALFLVAGLAAITAVALVFTFVL